MALLAPDIAVVLLTITLLITPALSLEDYIPLRKPCPAGCEKHGNCNIEDGRCECPWGYGGEDCSKMMMPACRLTPDSTVISCDENLPKNCECFRQCMSYVRQPGQELQPRFLRPDVSCFEYEGVPIEQQLSTPPAANQTNAKYYRFYEKHRQQPINRTDGLHLLDHWVPGYSIPLQHCPSSCTNRGACIGHHPDATAGQCICFKGYAGPACENVVMDPNMNNCLNNCNGAGQCQQGFCRCGAGRFGKDCSRSSAWQPAAHNSSPQPSHTKLRLYIYELPTHLAHEDGLLIGWNQHDAIYTAYQHFMRALYQDWSVRTDNPWQADLFYVPALTYFYSGNVNPLWGQDHMRIVVKYIRERYPFWDRRQGKDHVFWFPCDRGTCQIPPDDPIQNPIKLVHFAYYERNPVEFAWIANKDYGCFLPSRDVAAAPYFKELWEMARMTYINGTYNYKPDDPKDHLLFFAGGVRHDDKEYSGGVRQYLHNTYKDGHDPDIQINEGYVGGYWEAIRSSKFCLSPYGHGWGIRTSIYMANGCVPVIIQDHVFQPYETVLPYQDFSIRLAKADIERIGDILRAVSDDEYLRLRRNLPRYYGAFVWEPEGGGLAYNYTIAALHKKYTGLLSSLYKH